MSRNRPGLANRSDRGAGLVEVTIAAAVLGVALTGALVSMERGAAYQRSSTAMTIAQGEIRGALAGVSEVMSSTSFALVDSTMRLKSPTAGVTFSSDRFPVFNAGLGQCQSAACGFHTSDDITFDPKRLALGAEHCTGNLTSAVRGAILPFSNGVCPYDSCALSGTVYMDGVRVFHPYGPDGVFTASGDGSARYEAMVFFFPAAAHDGTVELRRYDVFIDDLLATAPTTTGNFTPFSAAAPTMIDLFDLGADGAVNGVRDGRVPNTTASSDATSEVFATANIDGKATILYAKTLSAPAGATYPTRSVDLRIELATGRTTLAVHFVESASSSFQWSSETTRPPKTLVRNLTGFAVSSSVTSPYDAVDNPTGVLTERILRVTLQTSVSADAGARTYRHAIDELVLRPRQ